MLTKRVIFLFLLLINTGCGFHPLYSSTNQTPTLESIKLGKVSLGNYPSKVDYIFQSELRNILSTLPNQHKKYLLDVTLNKSVSSYGTQQNSINTRSLLMLKANFVLREIDTDKIIVTNTQNIMDSYEVSISPYASIVSEDETANKLAKSLAYEILIRLEDEILNFETNEQK